LMRQVNLVTYDDFIRAPELFAFRVGLAPAIGVFALEFLVDPGAKSG
jgi:hypothetical protein